MDQALAGNAALCDVLICLADDFRGQDVVRPVGVGAVDNGISFLGGDLPEGVAGVAAVLADTEEVYFQWDVLFFAVPAQLAHLPLVEGGVAAVIDEVGMGEVDEFPGLQGLPALAAVEEQICVVVSGLSVVAVALVLVVDVVLAQQEVFDGIGLQKAQESVPDLRIVFRLKSQMDFDVIAVLVAEPQDSIHIVFQLVNLYYL